MLRGWHSGRCVCCSQALQQLLSRRAATFSNRPAKKQSTMRLTENYNSSGGSDLGTAQPIYNLYAISLDLKANCS